MGMETIIFCDSRDCSKWSAKNQRGAEIPEGEGLTGICWTTGEKAGDFQYACAELSAPFHLCNNCCRDALKWMINGEAIKKDALAEFIRFDPRTDRQKAEYKGG